MAIKKFKYLLLLIVVGVGCWIWGHYTSDPIAVVRTTTIDSIYIVNDSIETKIIYVEKEYEKKVDTIINNSDSANYVFFSNYISNYCRTIKDN